MSTNFNQTQVQVGRLDSNQLHHNLDGCQIGTMPSRTMQKDCHFTLNEPTIGMNHLIFAD